MFSVITLLSNGADNRLIEKQISKLEDQEYIVITAPFSEEFVIRKTNDLKMHMDKQRQRIDMCDRVYILNRNGILNKETKILIRYAKSKNKPIQYMENCNWTENELYNEIKDALDLDMHTNGRETHRRYTPNQVAQALYMSAANGGGCTYAEAAKISGMSIRTLVRYERIYKKIAQIN